MTLIFALPLGICGGIYFAEYAKKNKFNNVLITGVELLTAVPSLIFGLLGATIFLPLATKLNLGPLASSLTLTFIVVPTIIKTTEESIRSVDKRIKNGSLALGATKATTATRISVPQALPGILSGVLLSIGRIMGESAALVMIFGT
jgi:phosphate transport system permease protein